jgi:hypothetical protein
MVPLLRSDMVRRWALKVCREPEKEDKTVLLSRLNLGGLIDIRKAFEYRTVRPVRGRGRRRGRRTRDKRRLME